MAKLTLRQLEIVRTIVRTGSLTAASVGLGISQPAASRLLRHAEDQLGLPLFERRSNGLKPTHEARALTPEIDRIFEDLEYVERAAGDLRRLQSGRLRIAAIPSLGLTLLADAVGRFRTDHPGVSVSIQMVLNFEVADLVLNRRVDLGLAYLPTRTEELRVAEISRTSIVVVLPANHPLAGRAALSAEDVAAWPLISFSKALPIGQHIDAAFRSAGIQQPIGVEVGHSFLACALVRAGAGIALVDSLARRSRLFGDLIFVPFEPEIWIAAVLLSPADQQPSLIAAEFAAALHREKPQPA